MRVAWTGLVAVAVALAGCATGIYNQTAVFPDGESRWEIPLYRPVERADTPTVWATLTVREDGRVRNVEAPFVVDSGAFLSAMPEDWFDALGLELQTKRRVRVRDADGRERPFRGAVVPAMQLGTLALTEAPFGASRDAALIGQAILGEHPWSIDLDRGVMVLGSQPWTSGQVSTIELSHRNDSDLAELVVDGHRVLFVFDTGAQVTSIDEETGRELGLEVVALDEPRRMRAAHGVRTIEEEFVAQTLSFGQLSTGPVSLSPLREMERGGALNQKVVGLLGMDVMSRYVFRVEPGERFQVRPRRPLLETAEARINRWSWLPSCERTPHCVEGRVSHDGGAVTIGVDVRADFGRHTEFVFACTSGGSLLEGAPLVSVEIEDGDPEGSDDVTIPADADGANAERLRQKVSECDERLALIDVNPIRILDGSNAGMTVSLLRPAI
jgi:predicted aspartyl protease